ncbi:hypothetical protein BGZ68_001225 [Mortierella alpina]|nr:hypothetical protein BGZ68_001225 [Mortierella alpina]
MNNTDISDFFPATSQRRRQSVVYPAPSSNNSSTTVHNDVSNSLKPPSGASTHRNSIGIWGSSKSAASTPNLSHSNKSSDVFGPYSPTTAGPGKGLGARSKSGTTSVLGTESTPTAASGSGSGADTQPTTDSFVVQQKGSGVASSASSFHQRRKRSESISGIKNTAGTISRMVRKSSSTFLRKLVKNFDDSDAPPIPAMPTHSNQTILDHDAASFSSNINYAPVSVPTPTDTPELPPTSSKSTAGLGPLDLPPSPDHEQPTSATEPAGTPIPIPKSSSRADLDIELDEELSRSVSTVESWLKRTNSDMEVSALASAPITASFSDPVTVEDHAALNSSKCVPGVTSMAEATPIMSSSSTAASHITSEASESPAVLDLRRPSYTSTISTNDEDNNSDSEDIKVPITVLTMGSNRLSRMYETQSIQMAHSHTEELDAHGGSTMLSSTTPTAPIKSTRNSIRFSQYGLLLSKDLPLASQSGSSAFGYSRPDKPLPRRPVSLFMSSSSLASTLTETSESATAEAGADGEPGLGHSSQHLAVSSPNHGGLGTRPATICISPGINSISVTTASQSSVSSAPPVSPVTVTIRPLSSYVTNAPLHAPTVSLTPAPSPPPSSTEVPEVTAPQQDETMESLAFKTAKRCWAEDSTFLKRDEISPYLGAGSKPFNRLVLSFYMRHFNFSGKRLDTAFRLLCQKLMLRGETQEVDRVLEQFAARFVECNPESIFGHKDVVHAITYSILLLNTDLHVVKQSNANKMSRSAFVKNTLQVVLAQTEYREEHERQSEDSSAHGLSLSRTGTGELSVHGSGSGGGKRRTPSVKSWKSAASHQSKSSKMGLDPKANGGHGNGKWWIQELEQLLKDIYSTVKNHQILLPLTPRVNSNAASAPTTPTAGGFPNSSPQNSGRAGPMGSAGASRGYKPAPSTALIDVGFGGLGSGSGAFAGGGGGGSSSSSSTSGGSSSIPGSGENNSGSGSTLGSVLGLGRRNSTNARTRQLRQDAMDRLRAQETGSGAAEDDSGIRYGHAPSISVHDTTKASSMHGAMSSLPPIHTPSSSSSSAHHSNSFTSTPPSPASSIISQRDGIASRRGGHPPGQQHKPNLHGKSSNSSISNNNPRLRKEGILYRKHLLERADKKASNRSWRQLLVVLDRGGLSLFRADGQLGQAIEEQGILFDEIRLQHTITNVLPPPGYSSSRRHVFAIQLFTGAVYLFQAANAVDCEEWAKTCNYWAARTTKEPLPGGVINMDYGWGRSLDMFLQQQQQQQLQQSQQDSVLTGNNNSNHSVMMLSGNSSGSSLAALATATETSSSSNISLEDNNDDAKSVNNSLNAGTSFLNHPPPTSSGGSVNGSGSLYGNSGVGSGRAASIKSTSSRHHHFGSGGSGTSNVPLGDRVVLFEWSVPLPTMSMSMLTEEEQCEALKKYVAGLESDMETHQEHRVPMMKLFLPKSNNYVKAFNNWERRSRHLLKEMVKYQIYVESLEQSLAIERELKQKQDVMAEQLETELQHLEVEDDEDEERQKDDVVQEAC